MLFNLKHLFIHKNYAHSLYFVVFWYRRVLYKSLWIASLHWYDNIVASVLVIHLSGNKAPMKYSRFKTKHNNEMWISNGILWTSATRCWTSVSKLPLIWDHMKKEMYDLSRNKTEQKNNSKTISSELLFLVWHKSMDKDWEAFTNDW